MGLVTVPFDLLTLKLVRESHQRWGTFLPNLGTLGRLVLELFAMYATDGQTDGQTKATHITPFPNNKWSCQGVASRRPVQLALATIYHRKCVPPYCHSGVSFTERADA